MKFDNKLISGQFIKRYKRFFVDIKIKNKVVTAHCPNTGSMFGLLKKGNNVWLSKSNNPKRKLKYTLQIIEDQKSKVGVNTHLTNKIVLHALKNNLIKEFNKNIEIKPEFKFGENTRFDFLILKKKIQSFHRSKKCNFITN
jgi:sugar fermentation stimulation protein A